METQKKIIFGKELLLRDDKSLTSAALHFLGVLLAAVGCIPLLLYAVRIGERMRLVSYAVYGASMIGLYAASTTYHIFYISQRVHRVLRKLDHIMIFFLIAGTYTPLCIIALPGSTGRILFGIVWGMTIAGTLMNVFWIGAPRWLSALIYVVLGWAAIFAIVPLSRALPAAGMVFLVAGGLFYTVGAVLYAKKFELFPSRYFGNHELFHVFVLVGSLCHFLMIYLYL